MAQSVTELSVKPAKAVTSWLTDQIAPAYWKPNSLILVSDTHSPALCHPPPAAKSTLWCPEGCLLCGVLRLLYNPCLHVTRLNLDGLASSFLQLLVSNDCCYCFSSCARCAISVMQSSRTTTPSITAVPVGRVSAMAALPKLHQSLREAGVLPLSEYVTSALSRELLMQVWTLPVNVKLLLLYLN